MAGSVIGLEIAEEGIRAAEVSTTRTPTLLAAGAVPLPEDAAKDSEVLDPTAVTLALAQLWSQCRFSSRHVVLGVANRRLLVREYVSPRLDRAVLRETLPFAVQDLLPVPLEQAVLDFLPIRESAEDVSGLLVATVADGIERLISTLSMAKLRTDAVDFVPFGLVRALNAAVGIRPEPVAVASIGGHTTSVVVVEAGLPSFVRIVPVDLTPEHLPVPADQGASAPGGEGPARRIMPEAAGPAMPDSTHADLASRIRNTLDFHAGREGATPVAALFVTGAMATWDVAAAIAREVRMDIGPLAVTDVVRVAKPVAEKGTPPPSLLNAVGIALGDPKK
ncbi:pilus assembly protein PilM [Propionicicella superfundia]|uniref:pilus assembly protein PilM n=1 Tax=Propionicicella superfundia TaxID=348582 RepID=UPI000424F569|nr:pilus assembly protein PilM [Propionicicella superfundia]